MASGYSSETRGQVEPSAPDFGVNWLVGIGLVVAALYFGRDVFVPFVLAVVLSFVLAVPVRFLQGLGLGRVFPVAAVVLVAFLGIVATAGIVASQLADLAGDLPKYQTTIRAKISGLREAATGKGPLENAAALLQTLSDDLGVEEKKPAEANPPAGGTPKPVPVEIAGTRAPPLERIAGIVGTLLHPLAMAGLVVVFVVFILLRRNDLRNRLIRLAGSHDLQRTTAAMNDAARRLSRFFLTQVLLNSSFGVVVGIGLWALGVPSPVLWGILAAISRFVPYVGVVLAAGGPLILAAAVDPNWTMLLWTAAFFASIEFVVGQMIEPMLFGHSTGLTPIAVIASVTFWTLLWGPIGLLLATPLTVCLVVLGRHVEKLQFIEVLLGDRPPLTAAESFYQRTLAGDAGEAIEQAEVFLEHHALATFYDEVAIKGLALAQVDHARGALDEKRLARVESTIVAIVDDLSDHEDEVPESGGAAPESQRAAGDEGLDQSLAETDSRARALPSLDASGSATGVPPVICLAGRNGLDRAAASMLAQLLGKHGLAAETAGPESLSARGLVDLPAETRIVCLSYLDSSTPVHVRYATRRLRRRLPNAVIVVCSWGVPPDQAGNLCQIAKSDHCASSLTEAARICLDEAGRSRIAATSARPVAASEPAAALAAAEPAAA